MHHFTTISEFKLEPQSGNAQFGVKIGDFWSCVILRFDGWPWETIGHLFNSTSSFVHFFPTIGEFKLYLQSGSAQFKVKVGEFCSRVTSKFDGWSWKTIKHLFYVTSSFVHNFTTIGEFELELQSGKRLNSGQNQRFLVLCDLEIWRKTLENNMAPLICYFKLCALFHSHRSVNSNWSYSPETTKFGQNLFWPLWPWPLTSDLDLLHGYHFCKW